jgi:hypothetical protein
VLNLFEFLGHRSLLTGLKSANTDDRLSLKELLIQKKLFTEKYEDVWLGHDQVRYRSL